jgi:hypothetical protein
LAFALLTLYPAQAQQQSPIAPSLLNLSSDAQFRLAVRSPFRLPGRVPDVHHEMSLLTPAFSSSRPATSSFGATPPQATPAPPTESDAGDSCDPTDATNDEKLYSDCRGVFDASFFLGLAIDTFAGAETLTYLNPGAAGKTQERAIGGFVFQYRLLGDKTPMVHDHFHPTLWVYGETVHGVRSVDINCTQNPNLPVCVQNLGTVTNPGEQLYFILRNATSLEGYMGFRYEFKGLMRDSNSPANIYLKAQAGFLTVAGGSGSALDMHRLALGAIATKGRFENSYLEVGWGRSDTFATARRKRVKIAGYLEWKIPKITDVTGLSGFAQLLVDTDLGRGSDAIQSYIGINYDLDQLFHK